MKTLMSFALCDGCLAGYSGVEGLTHACASLGCDGLEVICDDRYGGPLPEHGLVIGYHLCFWPDWLDFWQGNEQALLRKFGSRDAWVSFYGGETREALLRYYRADLARAERLGAHYAVFHVSDASIEEQFLYQWKHTDEEIIDGAADLLNEVLDGREPPFPILLENQWWPGLRLTDPALTARLLARVRCRNKGILLDTGHLLNTNPALRTETEAAAYIHHILDLHGPLAAQIRGVHLHCSLSGAYVQAHTGILPPDLAEDYLTRYGQNYAHVLQIDRHLPWTDPAIAGVLRQISPEFLVHELAGSGRPEKEQAVRIQAETLKNGGLTPENGKSGWR
ncbi:MAG: sugar phosphate isomerase/epimerase [Clostridiaceae bacterium]|nr:sugar phosphate isomerase/epimerase [Clostridiaceae bacterium]